VQSTAANMWCEWGGWVCDPLPHPCPHRPPAGHGLKLAGLSWGADVRVVLAGVSTSFPPRRRWVPGLKSTECEPPVVAQVTCRTASSTGTTTRRDFCMDGASHATVPWDSCVTAGVTSRPSPDIVVPCGRSALCPVNPQGLAVTALAGKRLDVLWHTASTARTCTRAGASLGEAVTTRTASSRPPPPSSMFPLRAPPCSPPPIPS
jgi:hypothetical protein